MRLCTLISLLMLLLSRSASASESADQNAPLQVDLRVDLPLTISTGILGGSLHALREQIVTNRCAPHCDGSRVNAVDRINLGDYRSGAATAGDILVGVNMAFPLAFDFAYQRATGAPWKDFLVDSMIVSESLAISIGIHQLVSLSTQRPRPYAYSTELGPDLADDANSYLSFYSGHTANSFVAATATSYVFSVRYPRSSWRIPLWAVSHGLAALDGYLRIAAGYHHVSDVVVGAIVGSSIGLVVPTLHRSDGSSGRQARLTPMPVPGGAVLSVTWTN